MNHIDCETCSEHLVDFHYGELSADLHQALGDHLSACSECAKAYCRLHADLTSVNHAFLESPGQAVQQRLKAAVQKEFALPWYKRVFGLLAHPIPAYQTALVVAVGLFVFSFFIAQNPGRSLPGKTSARQTTISSSKPIVENYDASRTLAVNPNVF